MIQPLITIYKPLGMTPLQTIEIFISQHTEYKDAKISYAGRLDPMAEGLLLLLINEENKKRKTYEDLPKTYEFSLLLGVATDTYDLMGKVMTTSFAFDNKLITKQLLATLPSFIGTHTFPYPPYSSQTVNGKPLFWYARNNLLSTISIPTKNVTISDLTFVSTSLLPTSTLLNHISRIIPNVQGDFRQGEIVTTWNDTSSIFPSHLHELTFQLTCSSGTYVRQLVHEFGTKIGVPTVTFSIKRTRVGKWTENDALKLEYTKKR